MERVRNARRVAATVLLLAVAALGTGGCLLVPAPVPVAGPVIVTPRPYGYHYGGGHYRHGYYGRPGYGHWR